MSIVKINGLVLDIRTEHPMGLKPQQPYDVVTIKQNGVNLEIETEVGTLIEGDNVVITINKQTERRSK